MYYNSQAKFMSSHDIHVNGFPQRIASGRIAFAILLTKLKTGLSSSILRTIFNVKSKQYLNRIFKRA